MWDWTAPTPASIVGVKVLGPTWLGTLFGVERTPIGPSRRVSRAAAGAPIVRGCKAAIQGAAAHRRSGDATRAVLFGDERASRNRKFESTPLQRRVSGKLRSRLHSGDRHPVSTGRTVPRAAFSRIMLDAGGRQERPPRTGYPPVRPPARISSQLVETDDKLNLDAPSDGWLHLIERDGKSGDLLGNGIAIRNAETTSRPTRKSYR